MSRHQELYRKWKEKQILESQRYINKDEDNSILSVMLTEVTVVIK